MRGELVKRCDYAGIELRQRYPRVAKRHGVPLLPFLLDGVGGVAAMNVEDGVDGTSPTDYTAEREDPSVRDLPDPLSDEPLAGPPPGSAAAPGR